MEEGLYLCWISQPTAAGFSAYLRPAAVHGHPDGHTRLWDLIWQPRGASEGLSVSRCHTKGRLDRNRKLLHVWGW